DYRRTAAVAMIDLSGVESRRGRHEESRRLAVEAVELVRDLAARTDSRPRDPLLLTMALEKQAVALRELGQLDEALGLHEDELARARELAVAAGADNNDAHFLDRAILERARTLAQYPQRRDEAENSLAEAIAGWERLAKDFTRVPSYREWLGIARDLRGRLRI